MISLSRRSFLSAGGAWLGSSLLGRGGEGELADGERTRTVSIFHTTDLHGHIRPTRTYEGEENLGGFARCATRIRAWRRERPDSLLVDLGDLYQGTPESHGNQGRLMSQLLSRLGYDAWVPGNHDLDWGREVFEANMEHAKLPLLCANLDVDGRRPADAGGGWSRCAPWTLREVGGFRIALIGLITPGLPFWLPPELLAGIRALDPVEPLRRAVAEARAAGADAVVALCHMGFRQRDDFANPLFELFRSVAGVDACLAGHSHQNQPTWDLHGVLCSQASYHGIHCGRLELTFDRESRKLIRRQGFTERMDATVAADPVVMDLAEPELRKSDESLARLVATVRATLPGTGRGSRLARLFCESFAKALQRAGSPVDGVFHGTFGTGDLAPGPLRVADCWRLLPYENFLVTAEITGSQLAEILQEDAKDTRSDRTLWPYEVETEGSGRVVAIRREGRTLGPDERVRIAFNSYDAQSAGRRAMRLHDILQDPAAKRQFHKQDARSALMDLLAGMGELK